MLADWWVVIVGDGWAFNEHTPYTFSSLEALGQTIHLAPPPQMLCPLVCLPVRPTLEAREWFLEWILSVGHHREHTASYEQL